MLLPLLLVPRSREVPVLGCHLSLQPLKIQRCLVTLHCRLLQLVPDVQSPPPLPSLQSTAPDSSSVLTNPVSTETCSLAGLHRFRSGSYTLGPISSFQRAAQIYSQRLSRPSSGKVGECSGIHNNLLVQYKNCVISVVE